MTERFTLLSELGRGGMGVVWKARDEETGSIVALKLLRETYAEDPEYLARFERELELARRIDSNHVVKVLGFGVRGKVPYLALEYVAGPSLHDALVAHGRYGWPEARALLAQLAQGLADANAAAVIHRDVKPSNVLIAPDGTAKLTDFGIARGLDLTRFTATSTILGTPAYLAPEGPKDARSDLYSLGIIGYELLTGAVPFKGTSYQEVIVEHIRTVPDLAQLPPEARPVIGWLLAKDPAERPQRASALLPVLWGGAQAPGQLPIAPPFGPALATAQSLPAQPVFAQRSSSPAVPPGAAVHQPHDLAAYVGQRQGFQGWITGEPAWRPAPAVPGRQGDALSAGASGSAISTRGAIQARLGAGVAFLGAIAAAASPWIVWLHLSYQGDGQGVTAWWQTEVELAGYTGNFAVVQAASVAVLIVASIVCALLSLALAWRAASPVERLALAVCALVAGVVVIGAVLSAYIDLDTWTRSVLAQDVSPQAPGSVEIRAQAGLFVAAGGGVTVIIGAMIAALSPRPSANLSTPHDERFTLLRWLWSRKYQP